MPADLVLLRVACNVVEGRAADESPQHILRATPHSPFTAASAMATRSPYPTHAADLVLGLKALTAKPNPHKRARVETREPPRSMGDNSEHHRIQLPALMYAARPTLLPPLRLQPVHECSVADDRSAMRAAPATLVSFLGHKHKRGEERVPMASPSDATSPRSVWEDASAVPSPSETATLSPVGSPVTTANVHTTVSLLRVPTIPLRPSLPQSVCGEGNTISLHSSALTPPASIGVAAAATSNKPLTGSPPRPPTSSQRPQLTRKTSSQWRQEMPAQDRCKTKDRLRRALHTQCDGDYDKLLRIICAMEEEALHVHTTSKAHYMEQSTALRDRIDALSRSSSSSLSFTRATV